MQYRFAQDLPYTPSILRRCGDFNVSVVANPEAVCEDMIEDNSGAAFNPSSDITSIPAYPICWPAFAGTSQYQEDHCLWLRQKYCKDPGNPKIEEWKEYVRSLQPADYSEMSGIAYGQRDWKGYFDKARDVTYRTSDGTSRKLYPLIDACSDFMDGKGYIPSIFQQLELRRMLTYGLPGISITDADAINRSLYAIGGNVISATGWTLTMNVLISKAPSVIWTIIRHTDNSALYVSGPAIIFADIDLSELTED